MSDFEKQYYENENFWKDSLQDDANKNRIIKTAELVPKGINNLVDLGCGNGIFLNYLKEHRQEVELTGMDRSVAALKYVKVKTIQGSVDVLPFQDNAFDCVSCLEVIEHLPVDIFERSLKEIARVSNKYIVISVPYNEKLEDSFNCCPECKTSFSYEMHVRSFDDNRMDDLFVPLGYQCISKQYLGEQSKLIGHSFYQKLVYPNHLKRFVSPICPICGFQNKDLNTSDSGNEIPKKKKISVKQRITSFLTALPKKLWPREKKYYWVLCLYEKRR